MRQTKFISAAATAVMLTAACSPSTPAPQAPPSTSSQRMMPVLDADELPRGMNPDLAAGAAYRGHPYVFAASGERCRIWMRLPDGQVWSMPPLSQINHAGVRMTPQPRESYPVAGHYGPQCEQQGPAANSGAADPAAASAAKADGVPYVATARGWDDGCHAFIQLPDGTSWGIDDTAVGGYNGELTGDGVRANSCD